MEISVRWRSQRGTRTEDNRDHAGIGIAGDGLLAIVSDGSTTGKESGKLAQHLVENVVDWFVSTSDIVGESEISEQLRDIHKQLVNKFPHSSASYLMIVLRCGSCFVAYAGDCILGTVVEESTITWLTAPDTLATALSVVPVEQLAKDRSRHLLTRSLRTRRFMAPTFQNLESVASPLLIATDGFWAELPADMQLPFLSGKLPPFTDEHDDRSALGITLLNLAGATIDQVETDGEIYLRQNA